MLSINRILMHSNGAEINYVIIACVEHFFLLKQRDCNNGLQLYD